MVQVNVIPVFKSAYAWPDIHIENLICDHANGTSSPEENTVLIMIHVSDHVPEAFTRAGIEPGRASSPDQANTEAEVTQISISTNEVRTTLQWALFL